MATRKQLEQQFIQDRAFWGSVSGRWRGLAGGILVGAALGVMVGLGATLGFSAFSEIAIAEMGRATLVGMVGMFASAGMLVGGSLWANAGTVAGAVASGLIAQKELEKGNTPSLEQEISSSIAAAPASKPQPLLNPKVMGLGAAITGAVGAFLAYNNMLPTSAGYAMLGQPAGTALAAGAAAVSFATFGAIFGVAFKPWQSIKNYTDGLFEGRVTGRSYGSMEHVKAQVLATQITPTAAESYFDTAKAVESASHFAEKLTQQRNQNLSSQGLSV